MGCTVGYVLNSIISLFIIILEIPEYIDAGTHLFQNCSETITIESGCEIVNRKCKCWDEMQLCKTKSITRWDFKNLEVTKSDISVFFLVLIIFF